MTTEERLAALENRVARNQRMVLVILVVVPTIALMAAAAGPLIEVSANSLFIKTPDGNTVTALTANGDAIVGGNLSVKGNIDGMKGQVIAWCVYDLRSNRLQGSGVTGVKKINSGEYQFTFDKSFWQTGAAALSSSTDSCITQNSKIRFDLGAPQITVLNYRMWDSGTGKLFDEVQRSDFGQISLALISK